MRLTATRSTRNNDGPRLRPGPLALALILAMAMPAATWGDRVGNRRALELQELERALMDLQSDRSDVRIRGLHRQRLTEKHGPVPIEDITALLLGDPVVEVRRAAALELAFLHQHAASAMPDLVAAIVDPEPAVRAAAACALARIGPLDAAADSALRRAREDGLARSLPEVEVAFAFALGETADETMRAMALDSMERAANRSSGRDMACRVYALVALAPDLAAAAIPGLVEKGEHSGGCEVLALAALGETPSFAVPYLETLADPSVDAKQRIFAAYALELLQVRRTEHLEWMIDALLLAAFADDLRLAEFAVSRLSSLGEAARAAAPGLRQLVQASTGDLRRVAALAMISISVDDARKLAAELAETDPDLAAELEFALEFALSPTR